MLLNCRAELEARIDFVEDNLGDLEVDKNSLSETFIEDKKNDKKEQIVRMKMLLDKPIKDDLYKYIID